MHVPVAMPGVASEPSAVEGNVQTETVADTNVWACPEQEDWCKRPIDVSSGKATCLRMLSSQKPSIEVSRASHPVHLRV